MADNFLSADDARGAINDLEFQGGFNDATFEGIYTDVPEKDDLPQDLQFYQTSTTAYKTGRKPRTVRAAYDSESETMYVVFWDGSYFMYSEVPPEVWTDFKGAPSKGEFLWNEGFDDRGPKGVIYAYQPVDMTKVSARRQGQLRSNYEMAKKLQARYQGEGTFKRLHGKGHNYRLRGTGGWQR